MEKLQAAIEKAKSRRKEQPAPETQPNTNAGKAKADTQDIETLWSALQPFTPRPKTLLKNRIATSDVAGSTTHYDMLRTRILQRVKREGWRRIMITSPDSGCGKSTISSNLALSFARNAELRTILIDLDLRRPSIGKLFGCRGQGNLHDVLLNNDTFENHALRLGANLAITTNQSPAQNSSELLQSEGALKVLDDIEQQYQPDIMLFDMPPMLGSDDTHAFMQQVDCAILIAAAENTTLNQIESCEKDLAEHLPVLGVVLNKCRYMGQEQGYGYGY